MTGVTRVGIGNEAPKTSLVLAAIESGPCVCSSTRLRLAPHAKPPATDTQIDNGLALRNPKRKHNPEGREDWPLTHANKLYLAKVYGGYTNSGLISKWFVSKRKWDLADLAKHGHVYECTSNR